jgi:phosphoribosylglycinamide formyltransferase-1
MAPKVHEAVIAASKTESGITIHYVNEKYDEGETILQKKLPIAPGENAKSLAQKILTLEHEWLPKTIEQLIS